MNKSQRIIIAGVLAGLLIGLVAFAFEVPSIRAIARFGSFVLLAGLLVVLFWAFTGADKTPSSPKLGGQDGNVTTGLIGVVAALAVLVVVGFATMEFPTVKGNQIGVQENYSGVDPQPKPAGTYTLFRPSQEMYLYDISQQVLDIALEVKSSDNQQVHIKGKVRYRIDPSKAVGIHTTVGARVSDVLLAPEAVRVINTSATSQHAIAIYSGDTQNALRKQIEGELQAPTGELRSKGVIVDSFVFSEVKLDPAYTKEIEARQIATIAQTRAVEQQKAALAEAEKAKAEAQADLNRQVVAAQRDKEVGVLNAQQKAEVQVINAKAQAEQTVLASKADAEKTTIAAKAEADRNVAISNAQKQAELNRAVGIEAIGRAEAEANKLKLGSFAVAGSELFTRVEISKSLATAFSGVRGYLPQGVTYNTVAQDFDKSVSLLVGAQPAAK